MSQNPLPDDLPADLRAYLDSVPPATPEMAARVAAANRALEDDPGFHADFLKALFIEKMYSALEERNETKASLADRLGKSRQYIQKLFSESKRVNFTLETICEVAYALKRRVYLHICQEHEHSVVITRPRPPVLLKAEAWMRPAAPVRSTLTADTFILSTNAFSLKSRKGVHDAEPIAA